MVYQWKFAMGIPAQMAGEELERIEEEHGRVTPELVLEESRDEGSTLHNCFEWNDSVAAEKYRLRQAKCIISNLTVIVDEKKQSAPVRAFVNIEKEAPAKKGKFVNIVTAMNDENSRQIVLDRALSELKEFRKKYKDLKELSGVFAEVDKLEGAA